MISILPLLVCLSLACGQDPRVTVVVGSGEVRPAIVEQVRAHVDTGLEVLRPTFPGLEPGPFSVFVHGSAEELPSALAAIRHPGAPGFALLGQHQIHLIIGDVRRSGANLASVVRHELVHELLDQFVSEGRGELPRWFHEGLAQYLAEDTYLGAREEDLVWRVGVRRLLAFGDLRRSFPRDEEELRVAYAQSYSYVSWLAHHFGLDDVVRVAAATDADTTFEQALVHRMGRSTLELHDAWTTYLVYGSGAWWRVLLNQCFNALLFLALPALAVGWWRRRRRGQLIGARMERRAELFPHEFDFERAGPEPDPVAELPAAENGTAEAAPDVGETPGDEAENPGRDGDPRG